MQTTTVRSPVAALLASLALDAHAASFDCKAAKSPTEKTICASPVVSALDERLAADYARALHALSPAGAARLKTSQRSWLRFATAACLPPRSVVGGDPPASCLEAQFQRRLEQLAQAGVRIGPYVFTRIDAYESARTPKLEDGAYFGLVAQHVAFPQIDAPLNDATMAWNAAQRKDEPGPFEISTDPNDVHEDDDTDYTLGCVGDRFISLRVDDTEYQHGVAHGSYSHEVRNALLVPALRDMKASDVFGAAAPWKTKLPALFWSVYTKGPDAARDMKSIRNAIAAAAADPKRWLLTPAGLQIAFDADEAGCYACNPGPLTVPWSALKPMLASQELAACQASPTPRP
jgi:uncharacterized protein